MTRSIITLLFLTTLLPAVRAQLYTTANAHSHNDYLHTTPFQQAFNRNFGSIEADVFERDGELYVAHEAKEISSSRTLRTLYLEPLQAAIKEKKGIFADNKQSLQLLIDFKTPGLPTIRTLINQLNAFPEITGHPQVKLVISGDRPAPDLWEQYPAFIRFDGIPSITYTDAQLKRIAMISDNFRRYTQWNGKGIPVKEEMAQIRAVINKVHATNKPFRFWATPDNINTWKTMIKLGVDFLNTDKIDSLADYLQNRGKSEYQSSSQHKPYKARYRNNDKASRVKNVILLIGDGMGLAQVYAGYTANGGYLNLLQFLNIGFSKTASADSYITDSAAGGTAMATGKKTNNRYIGVDTAGKPLPAIPDLVAPMKMVSGLISSGDITDATPAAFYAHNKERSRMDDIAEDFLKSPVSLMIGAGKRHFQPFSTQLQSKGYVIDTTFMALDTIRSKKFLVLADSAQLPVLQGRGQFLTRTVQKALQTLSAHPQGFFLMAEGAQIDWGGHQNSMAWLTSEMTDFDKAIGAAMQFADANGETLVIVTADHETGGLSLLDGDIRKGYVDGHFSTNDHSAVMVPVFAYGPHSMDFRGVYENTEIFEKIMRVIRQYHSK
jgi:alkaline phosphatase